MPPVVLPPTKRERKREGVDVARETFGIAIHSDIHFMMKFGPAAYVTMNIIIILYIYSISLRSTPIYLIAIWNKTSRK